MASPESSVTTWLVAFLACFSSVLGNNMGPDCSSLTDVIVYYKNYYDIYLGEPFYFSGSRDNGLAVRMLKEANQLCCSTANLTLSFLPDNVVHGKEIEELVVDSIKADQRKPPDGVLKFFYPEFAFKKLLQVYDTQTPFVRLSQSPGPALLMPKPKPKDPVFVGEIIVKSWAIMIFLITFAWVIGTLAWMSDHHVNPKDFPGPFYIGMFEGFWWSVITMTTVGYGDKTPKGAIARILAVAWIMISTVFLSLFTANASSILAISQAEEDYTNTLGKKIGCFNSKHFFDVELNLGSQLFGYSHLETLAGASLSGHLDRLLFPNYLDYIYLSSIPKYSSMDDAMELTNTLDHPFQIGMAYAVDVKNMTSMENSFLRCLRAELPSLEKRIRRENIDISSIQHKSKVETEKLPLNSDSLLTLTYWFFAIIGGLVSIGLSWDFWVYWKRIRPLTHQGAEQTGDIEMPPVSIDNGINDPSGSDIRDSSLANGPSNEDASKKGE